MVRPRRTDGYPRVLTVAPLRKSMSRQNRLTHSAICYGFLWSCGACNGVINVEQPATEPTPTGCIVAAPPAFCFVQQHLGESQLETKRIRLGNRCEDRFETGPLHITGVTYDGAEEFELNPVQPAQ